MSIPNLILIISLFVFVLGVVVVKSDYKKRLNRYFGFGAFMISVWVLLNYFFSQYNSELVLRLIYAHAPFLVIATLTWVAFLDSDILDKKIKIFNIFALIGNTIFAYILLTDPFIVTNVVSYAQYTTGPMFVFYIIYIVVLFVVLVSYMIYQSFHVDKESIDKFILILIGLAVIMVVATIVGFVLPSVGITKYNLFDSASSIFFIIAGAYSILKNKFLDIRTIATEVISYILLLLMFILLFIGRAEISIFIRIILFLVLIYGVVILIKSVNNEIQQKEKLQELSTQLAEANVHLKDLDKMKTEFVSLASHELLTPVSAIEGYLSMMLDEKLVKIDDPKAILYMDRVYRSAKRLARLIADMLNISRIEEGRLSVEKQDVDLVETINQVLEELKFKAEEHKQKMVFENDKFPISNVKSNPNDQNSNEQKDPDSQLPTPHSSPFMTFADPDKVKEILVNIIGNSIKYTMEPGTIHITVEKVPTATLNTIWGKLESEIMARPVDDQESIHAVGDEFMKQIVGSEQYFIRVKDEGVGIPKEELPRLFKKFHRVGDFSTQESQGTGLGLYITRALVELHHGRIWPDSEGMGKG